MNNTNNTRPAAPHALAAIAAEAQANNYKEIEAFYTVRGGKVTQVLLYGIQRQNGFPTYHDINPYYTNCPDFLAAWAYVRRANLSNPNFNISLTRDVADFFHEFNA